MANVKKDKKRDVIIGSCFWLFIVAVVYSSCSEHNPALRAPITFPPRTDMLEHASFSGVPKRNISSIRSAVASLLAACPKISQYAMHGENLRIYYYPEGWEATAAHLDVELDLERESLLSLPQGLRDPQWGGHVELGLSGGAEPGAIMEMPLPEWLCDVPVDEDILSSVKRDWSQAKILLPIPGIRPGSF